MENRDVFIIHNKLYIRVMICIYTASKNGTRHHWLRKIQNVFFFLQRFADCANVSLFSLIIQWVAPCVCKWNVKNSIELLSKQTEKFINSLDGYFREELSSLRQLTFVVFFFCTRIFIWLVLSLVFAQEQRNRSTKAKTSWSHAAKQNNGITMEKY